MLMVLTAVNNLLRDCVRSEHGPHKDTGRQADRQADAHTHTHTDTHTDRHIHRHTHTDRHIHRQTDTHTPSNCGFGVSTRLKRTQVLQRSGNE